MEIKNLVHATKLVTDELQARGYEIRSGVFVNEGLNTIYTTVNPDGFDETFFLKFDRKPFYTAGREVNIGEKVGVAINWVIYDNYIRTSQAHILYALPEGIYHVAFDIFELKAIGPHPQKSNNEPVVIAPFSIFKNWLKEKREPQ